MKKVLVALALAGAISFSGCASLNIGGLDIAAVVAAVDATLTAECPILNGDLPTLQSIQAIIVANIPGLININSALITGENIAKAICAAATKSSAPSSMKADVHAPIFVDGVPVYFQ
jgi:hypothetical protein